eukprot:gene69361-biopygen28230
MGAVLSAFNKTRKRFYGSVRFPVGKYLHALINEEQIAVDATVLQYVRSSSFTNSITEFPDSQNEYQLLVPESALCLLASANEVASNDIIVKEIQKEFKAIWGNLLDHITSPAPESSQLVGQPLEDVFTRVLRMRILSSHLKEESSGQTTLMDLLAIKDMSLIKMLPSGMTSSPPTKVGSDEIVLVFKEKSTGDSYEIWWGHFTQGQAGEKEKGPYDQHGKFCQAVASITESDLEGDTGGYLRALKE